MKIRVSEIHVNQIRINQEVGVSSKKKSDLNFPKCPNVDIQIVCMAQLRILGKFLFKNGYSACGKVMFYRRETYLHDLLFDRDLELARTKELHQLLG